MKRHIPRGKLDLIDPVCVECGGKGKLIAGVIAYPRHPERAQQAYYRCDCGALVSCHPGTAVPTGRPASGPTRYLRSMAHQALDGFWNTGRSRMAQGFVRNRTYKWLARELGIAVRDCHIGHFTADQCRQVIALCAGRKEAA